MAIPGIRADTKDLRAVLAQHSEFAQKTVPQLVRSHARLCAVELALRTTPFSVGSRKDSAKKQGENSTANDIRKVMMGKKDFEAFISNFDNEKIRARIQSLITSGNWSALTEMLNKLGFAAKLGGVDFVNKSDFKTTHQKYRNAKTGRTRKPDKMHVATSDLQPYINKVIKRVGMSKGGWAECARQIGGLKAGKNGKAADNARGIPAWAKRSKKGGASTDNTKGRGNPHVLMTNSMPWVSRICTEKEQQNAIRIATEKMIESFVYALKAAAKKNAQSNQLKAV